MSSFLSSVFNRVTGPRISPSGWDSSTPLPAGTLSHKQTFKVAINSNCSVTSVAHGAWSHGTIEFEVAENVQPPSYNIAMTPHTAQDQKRLGGQQLGDGEGFLEVEVEARSNDEELWTGSRVWLAKRGEDHIQFTIETPLMTPAKLASQLSFHVRFSFPPDLISIAALTTSASQWRTIGHASLSALHIGSLYIETANAPITFNQVSTTTGIITNVNSPVSGSYDATDLTIKAENGKIEGRFAATQACSLRSANRTIDANVLGRTINVHNGNGEVKGTFKADETLVIDTANASITGTFVAPTGATILNSNSPIKGKFSVGPGSSIFKTSNAAIDVEITLITKKGQMGTPPLLAADEKRQVAQAAIGGVVKLEAMTSNSDVDLKFVEHPEKIILDAMATSSNSKVNAVHSAPFSGSFELATSNSGILVKAPDSHSVNIKSSGSNRTEGTISQEDGPSSEENKIIAKTSNAAVSFIIL